MGLAVTLCGTVYVDFAYLNRTVDQDIREEVALWLLGEVHPTPWPVLARRVFNGLFGKATWTRRGAWSIVVFVYFFASALFFWGNDFVLLGRVERGGGWYNTVDISDWFGLWSMLALFTIPPQFLLVPKSRWLLSVLGKRPVALLIPVILLEVFLTLATIFAWQRLAKLPYRLGLPYYSELLANYHFRLDISFVEMTASYISVSWLFIALAALIIRIAYVRLGRMFGIVSGVLSKERIAKEPLKLIGEAIAGLVFILVCLYGLA